MTKSSLLTKRTILAVFTKINYFNESVYLRHLVDKEFVFKMYIQYFSLDNVFPGGYPSSTRAGYQVIALLITLGISLVSGAITGLYFMIFDCMYCTTIVSVRQN